MIVQAATVPYCICKRCVMYCKCAVSICKWATRTDVHAHLFHKVTCLGVWGVSGVQQGHHSSCLSMQVYHVAERPNPCCNTHAWVTQE